MRKTRSRRVTEQVDVETRRESVRWVGRWHEHGVTVFFGEHGESVESVTKCRCNPFHIVAPVTEGEARMGEASAAFLSVFNPVKVVVEGEFGEFGCGEVESRGEFGE